jgi:hypothetical protein
MPKEPKMWNTLFSFVTNVTKIVEFESDFEDMRDTYEPITTHYSCCRLNDASFNAKPTIELLYTTGYLSRGGGPDDQHFGTIAF